VGYFLQLRFRAINRRWIGQKCCGTGRLCSHWLRLRSAQVWTRFRRWLFWEQYVRIGKETTHILLALLLFCLLFIVFLWLCLVVVLEREFNFWVCDTINIILLSGLLNVERRLYIFILLRLDRRLFRLRLLEWGSWARNHFSAETQILIFFAVIGVVFNDRLQIGHVEGIKELVHRELFFFQLYKELLCVAAGLCTWASAHVLLNPLPFFAVNFKRL